MNEQTVFTLKPIGKIEYKEGRPGININNKYIRGLKLLEHFRTKALYGSEDRKFTFSYKSEKTGRSGTIERPIGGRSIT